MGVPDARPLLDHDVNGNACKVNISNAPERPGSRARFLERSDDHHAALAFILADMGVTILPSCSHSVRYARAKAVPLGSWRGGQGQP